jgi:hypothetical protein
MSMVERTLKMRMDVPRLSAKNTCPGVKMFSSKEFDPKARAAGQLLPKIAYNMNKYKETDLYIEK